MFGILDEVDKKSTPIPTMHAYKLPEGVQVVKEWDLYPKAKAWPDRPFVRLRLTGILFLSLRS